MVHTTAFFIGLHLTVRDLVPKQARHMLMNKLSVLNI